MNKDEALKLALEALKELVAQTEGRFFCMKHDHVALQNARYAIARAREALAPIEIETELALQALHDENERLGLYEDAYGAQPAPVQEPVAWVEYETGNNTKRPQNCGTGYCSCIECVMEPEQEPVKLWLWKNFVNGRPEYWAFDNPFPCLVENGDPLTVGEPCGWAFLKPSVNGRPERSEQEVINTVTRLSVTSPPPQRTWVGLTDEERNTITRHHAYVDNIIRATEAKLKEKNT